MPSLRFALAVAALTATAALASASSHVVAFSSSSHFSCAGGAAASPLGLCDRAAAAPPVAPRAAADLLRFLSGSATAAADALPVVSARFAFAADAPAVVLAVAEAEGPAAPALLARIAAAVGAPAGAASSFSAVLDGAPDPPAASGGRAVRVDALARMAGDGGGDDGGELFARGEASVLSVEVASAAEREVLLEAIRALATRAGGRLAVVWTAARAVDEGEETEKARESAEKGGAAGAAAAEAVEEAAAADAASAAGAAKPPGPVEAGAAGVAANATAAEAAVPAAAKGPFAADGSLVKTTARDPPPISTPVATGLVVSFILLLILLPGIVCLCNIQAPAILEVTDKDDAKKKMQ
jgi:trimeric autotransporter adhesin